MIIKIISGKCSLSMSKVYFNCPYCLDMLGVNHFKWSALECLYCKNTIDMEEYKNSDEGSWLSEYVG